MTETFDAPPPPMSDLEAIKYNARMCLNLADTALAYKALRAEDRDAIEMAVQNIMLGLSLIEVDCRNTILKGTLYLTIGERIVAAL